MDAVNLKEFLGADAKLLIEGEAEVILPLVQGLLEHLETLVGETPIRSANMQLVALNFALNITAHLADVFAASEGGDEEGAAFLYGMADATFSHMLQASHSHRLAVSLGLVGEEG